MSKMVGSGDYPKTLSCRVPETVYNEIKELCDERGEKLSDYLRDVFLAIAMDIRDVKERRK